MFGTDENLDVILNPDKGDVQIFQNLEVVPDGEVSNPYTQISLSDARAGQNPDVQVGDEHTREIILPILAAAQYLRCARHCSLKFSTFRKRQYMPSSKDVKENLFLARFIRHGARKHFCSIARTTK